MSPNPSTRPEGPVNGRARPRAPLLRRSGKPWTTRSIEAGMFLVSLSALLIIALIFLFVGREALPVVFGAVNSALVRDVVPPEEAVHLPPDQLRRYLGLTRSEFARLDTRAIRELLALRVEAQDRIPGPIREDADARANTLAWRYLVLPHRWSGYDRAAYVWQPVSPIRKYNLVPLFLGSLVVAFTSLLVAGPLALGAALYVARLAPTRVRRWCKPAIELLAGLPTVVVGFLALVVLSAVLEAPARSIAGALGLPFSRLNALVAGTALALAVIPTIFSVAEDSLAAVPRSYVDAALALGATRWQAAWQVTVPAALPGLLSAMVLGFGRALGETMIVLMASGNAAVTSGNVFESTRTMAATIAAEMAEAVFGGQHYRVLFLVGTLLFAVTFLTNMAAELIRDRFIHRWEASR